LSHGEWGAWTCTRGWILDNDSAAAVLERVEEVVELGMVEKFKCHRDFRVGIIILRV